MDSKGGQVIEGLIRGNKFKSHATGGGQYYLVTSPGKLRPHAHENNIHVKKAMMKLRRMHGHVVMVVVSMMWACGSKQTCCNILESEHRQKQSGGTFLIFPRPQVWVQIQATLLGGTTLRRDSGPLFA